MSENNRVCRPADVNDSDVVSSAENISQHGVKEPFVRTVDGALSDAGIQALAQLLIEVAEHAGNEHRTAELAQ